MALGGLIVGESKRGGSESHALGNGRKGYVVGVAVFHEDVESST